MINANTVETFFCHIGFVYSLNHAKYIFLRFLASFLGQFKGVDLGYGLDKPSGPSLNVCISFSGECKIICRVMRPVLVEILFQLPEDSHDGRWLAAFHYRYFTIYDIIVQSKPVFSYYSFQVNIVRISRCKKTPVSTVLTLMRVEFPSNIWKFR